MKPRYTFSTVAVETRRFDSDLPFVCASKFSRERVTLLGMHNVVFLYLLHALNVLCCLSYPISHTMLSGYHGPLESCCKT
jgi:hypothetical protein